jgi:hypothetical protein
MNSVATRNSEKEERSIRRGGGMVDRVTETYPNFLLKILAM